MKLDEAAYNSEFLAERPPSWLVPHMHPIWKHVVLKSQHNYYGSAVNDMKRYVARYGERIVRMQKSKDKPADPEKPPTWMPPHLHPTWHHVVTQTAPKDHGSAVNRIKQHLVNFGKKLGKMLSPKKRQTESRIHEALPGWFSSHDVAKSHGWDHRGSGVYYHGTHHAHSLQVDDDGSWMLRPRGKLDFDPKQSTYSGTNAKSLDARLKQVKPKKAFGTESTLDEKTPPGFENVVLALKRVDRRKRRQKKRGINPWAVAWSMKNKGHSPSESSIDSLVSGTLSVNKILDQIAQSIN